MKTENDFYLIFKDEINAVCTGLFNFIDLLEKISITDNVKSVLYKSISFKINYMVKKIFVYELNEARDNGFLNGDTSEERFDDFIEKIQNVENKNDIIEKYPELYLYVQNYLRNKLQSKKVFFKRLNNDFDLIKSELFSDKSSLCLDDISVAGDSHKGGYSTLILSFNAEHASRQLKVETQHPASKKEKELYKCLYKPRASDVDHQFQEFFQWFNENTKFKFNSYKILNRNNEYSWCEFVEYLPCKNEDDVKAFYYNLGVILCLSYLTSSTDIHFENIIANGRYPTIIDYECCFYPYYSLGIQKNDYRPLVSSNYILPNQIVVSDNNYNADVNALTSGKKNSKNLRSAMILDTSEIDRMKFSEKQVSIQRTLKHLPILNNKECDAEDYENDFISGFEDFYIYVLENRKLFLSKTRDFYGMSVRVVPRATGYYYNLLDTLLHPKVLFSKKDYDEYIQKLKTNYADTPILFKAELNDIKNRDVPFFYARNNSKTILDCFGNDIDLTVNLTGIECVEHQITSILNKNDLKLQHRIIQSCFDFMNISKNRPVNSITVNQYKGEAAVDNLLKYYLNQIEVLMIDRGDKISWPHVTSFQQKEKTVIKITETGTELYDGILGICLTLAFAGKYYNPKYSFLAERCFKSYINSELENAAQNGKEHTTIDGFGSLGGGLYAIGQLYNLWNNKALLKKSVCKIMKIALHLIEKDEKLDIINGSAGYLKALMSLPKSYYTDTLFIESVEKCVNHIFKILPTPSSSFDNKAFETDQYLIGYAHGTIGISTALASANQILKRDDINTWILKAVEYENSFRIDGKWKIKATDNAYYASWCHGSTGMALGRLELYKYLKDDNLLKDAKNTIINSLESMFEYDNYSLCHGLTGSIDLMLSAKEFGILSKEKANHYIDELIRNIPEKEKVYKKRTQTGLMTGISGIAYEMLRVKYNIPSILI